MADRIITEQKSGDATAVDPEAGSANLTTVGDRSAHKAGPHKSRTPATNSTILDHEKDGAA